MKLMHLSIFVALLGLFSSCDKEDPIKGEIPKAKVKLKANKSEIYPFEDIKVTVDMDAETFTNTYDSITWQANGVAYDFFNPWYQEDEWNDRRFTDYRLEGIHTIYAFGYKDGIMISKDSIKYEMKKPKGDFLNFRWGQNKQNEYLYYKTGLAPGNYVPSNDPDRTKMAGVSLHCYYVVENTQKEYVQMEFWPWTSSFPSFMKANNKLTIPNVNDFDWHKGSEDYYEENPDRYNFEGEFFYNYLTELYGSPKLVYTGMDIRDTDLVDEFNTRFVYSFDYAPYPEMIWETPTAYICMLRAYTRSEVAKHRGIVRIIAQPRY